MDWTETGAGLIRRIHKHVPVDAPFPTNNRGLGVQLAMQSSIKLIEGGLAKFQADGLTIKIKNMSCLDPKHGHGVTMLHLLKELRAWE